MIDILLSGILSYIVVGFIVSALFIYKIIPIMEYLIANTRDSDLHTRMNTLIFTFSVLPPMAVAIVLFVVYAMVTVTWPFLVSLLPKVYINQ